MYHVEILYVFAKAIGWLFVKRRGSSFIWSSLYLLFPICGM